MKGNVNCPVGVRVSGWWPPVRRWGVSVLAAGPAVALPGWVPVLETPYPGPVVGGERDIADSTATRTTADGWMLHVDKTDEAINFAPALDGGVTTGEAFGTYVD